MILIDTSIWIDHFRTSDPVVADLLDQQQVLMHPMIKGELALGRLRSRDLILGLLDGLPQATAATDEECLALINSTRLYDFSIGYVDAHVLASARLSGNAGVWSRDKQMNLAALRLGVAAFFPANR